MIWVRGQIVPDEELTISVLDRTFEHGLGLFETLREMGADLAFEGEREEGGEPVADLRARFTGALKGVEVPPERAARRRPGGSR